MIKVISWRRLLVFAFTFVFVVASSRFFVVNAVVTYPQLKAASMRSTAISTGGVYDGVLMKMADLSYANLDAYVGHSLRELDNLSADNEGPPGISEQVQYVNRHDWHLSYTEANQYFFSDLENWKVISTMDMQAQSGFYAVAFQSGNTVVIAFRGTDNLQDLISDAGIYLSFPTWVDQLQPAKDFVNRVRTHLPKDKTYHIVFTGHSMGAWLAQKMYLAYLAKYQNCYVSGATVFDSIGTHFHADLSGATRVKDYRFQGDVFSHYGSSLGREIEIPDPTPDNSLYEKHQMHDFYPYFYSAQAAQKWSASKHPMPL